MSLPLNLLSASSFLPPLFHSVLYRFLLPSFGRVIGSVGHLPVFRRGGRTACLRPPSAVGVGRCRRHTLRGVRSPSTAALRSATEVSLPSRHLPWLCRRLPALSPSALRSPLHLLHLLPVPVVFPSFVPPLFPSVLCRFLLPFLWAGDWVGWAPPCLPQGWQDSMPSPTLCGGCWQVSSAHPSGCAVAVHRCPEVCD